MTTSSKDVKKILKKTLTRARIMERAGQLKQARQILLEAPDSCKEYGTYHYALGSICFRLADLETAIAEFESALETGAPIPEYFSNLGAACLERARQLEDEQSDRFLGRARQALERAVELGPKLPHPFINLGLVRMMDDQPIAAIELFDKALAIEPENPAALFNKAAALKKTGRIDDAKGALETLLRSKPDFEPAKKALEQLSA